MGWSKDWTIEMVEQNLKALGTVESEDIEQLIKDAKLLRELVYKIGFRGVRELLEE